MEKLDLGYCSRLSDLCSRRRERNLCGDLCVIWKNVTNTGHRNDRFQNHQITALIFMTVTLTYTKELPESSSFC